MEEKVIKNEKFLTSGNPIKVDNEYSNKLGKRTLTICHFYYFLYKK